MTSQGSAQGGVQQDEDGNKDQQMVMAQNVGNVGDTRTLERGGLYGGRVHAEDRS